MGIQLKIIRSLGEFLKNRTFRVKWGDQRMTKSCGSQGLVLGPLLFQICINDLADELTWNYLIFTDDVKVSASKLMSSIQHAFT